MKKYLKKHKFEKKLKKLCNDLDGKTILIYGTGKMFQTIVENYDLSMLKIIGVTDKKYTLNDENKHFFIFKIVFSKCKLENFMLECWLI